MTTATEALGHFSTLVSAEVKRELEKTAADVLATQSEFIKGGAFGGSRMYLAFGQHHARHLVAIREFIGATATGHLKPYAAQADRDTLTKLRDGVLQAFDDAATAFRSSLQQFTKPASIPGRPASHDQGAEVVLKQALERERKTLEAELAFTLSRPGRGVGPTGHRLAAILVTDVVGYTKLMAADEAATLSTLETCTTTLRETVERNGGRLVKTTGDGTLSEFGSAIDGMRSALEIQSAIVAQNIGRDGDKRVLLRMGLAVGDVYTDGDDILGDAVNLAARLEATAAPGTICIPESVRDDLANKLELAFEDLGVKELKNISRPVRVIQVTPK